MSGPKCASYSVATAVLREAQRRATARAGRDRLVSRIEALDTSLTARRRLGLPDASAWPLRDAPAVDSGTAEIEAWNSEATAAIQRAETELTELEQCERQLAMRHRLAAVASGHAAERIRHRAVAEAAGAARVRRTDATQPLSEPVVPRSERDAEITGPTGTDETSRAEDADLIPRQEVTAALIDRLPAGATSQELAALDKVFTRLTESTAAEFSSRLITAKAEMQRVERKIVARAEARQRAEVLLRTLDGFDGAEMDESRALLRRVIAGETPLLDIDVERVARARAAAVADFERRLVAAKIEEALRDAGMEVGAAFATDVVNRDRAYAAARSSEEHAVEVRLRDGLLDMRLVRAAGAPDTQLDTQAEIEFCKDVGRVSAALHGRGVDLELISHQPPGAVSVDVVPEAQSALDMRTRRHTKTNERKRQR